MAGTRPKTDGSDALARRVEWARASGQPVGIEIARLAEAMARHRGASLVGSELRLFQGVTAAQVEPTIADSAIGLPTSPYALGRMHELLMAPARRRSRGVHLTPALIAERLVACLGTDWVDRVDGADRGEAAGTGEARGVVLDPAAGGGAFLLAAADALVAAGRPPGRVVDRLRGVDIDAAAIAVTEAALAIWRLDHDLAVTPADGLVVGDALLDELPQAEVVVGNPPFLNQLRAASSNAGDRRVRLRERWPDLVTAYTDEAWLFLATAVDAVVAGGQVAMLQPVSVLAARHGDTVRSRVIKHASLTGLWVANGKVFDAQVEVCAPIVRVGGQSPDSSGRADGPAQRPALRRWVGAEFERLPDTPAPADSRWGAAGAGHLGAPRVATVGGALGVLGDLATATAGFRDQFYGLRDHVTEALRSRSRLVTVGMIDPLTLRWGDHEFRFAGARYRHPVVDLDSLAAADPDLARWVEARRRPKVLVATQTSVIEAWVDESSAAIPATPVISVEPNDEADLWKVAAALSAPPLSAIAYEQGFGTALSLGAIKLSARDLVELPLPSDPGAWREGAELAYGLQGRAAGGSDRDQAEDSDRRRFAEVMVRAYGLDDPALVEWWMHRLPKR